MKLIKLPQVIEKTSLSRSSIYDFMNKGGFPRSVSLGAELLHGLNLKLMTGSEKK